MARQTAIILHPSYGVRYVPIPGVQAPAPESPAAFPTYLSYIRQLLCLKQLLARANHLQLYLWTIMYECMLLIPCLLFPRCVRSTVEAKHGPSRRTVIKALAVMVNFFPASKAGMPCLDIPRKLSIVTSCEFSRPQQLPADVETAVISSVIFPQKSRKWLLKWLLNGSCCADLGKDLGIVGYQGPHENCAKGEDSSPTN